MEIENIQFRNLIGYCLEGVRGWTKGDYSADVDSLSNLTILTILAFES